MSIREDLEVFLRERLETLNEDMAWRCRESNLTPADWQIMMMYTFISATANLIANNIAEENDYKIVASIYKMIQLIRKEKAE